MNKGERTPPKHPLDLRLVKTHTCSDIVYVYYKVRVVV